MFAWGEPAEAEPNGITGHPSMINWSVVNTLPRTTRTSEFYFAADISTKKTSLRALCSSFDFQKPATKADAHHAGEYGAQLSMKLKSGRLMSSAHRSKLLGNSKVAVVQADEAATPRLKSLSKLSGHCFLRSSNTIFWSTGRSSNPLL